MPLTNRSWLVELYFGDDIWEWCPVGEDIFLLILEIAGLGWHRGRSCGWMLFQPPFFRRVGTKNHGAKTESPSAEGPEEAESKRVDQTRSAYLPQE